jgi:hypothetical protein
VSPPPHSSPPYSLGRPHSPPYSGAGSFGIKQESQEFH